MKNDYEKILEVGESFFSVKDAKGLLELILKYAKEICSAERSTIFIKEMDAENKTEILRSYMATQIGGELSEITVPVNIGIVGYTFKTGHVQLVNDVSSNPYFNPKIDEQTSFRTQSIISIPLVENFGKPFGVLQVLNKNQGEFGPSDIKKVKLLSLLAVAALTRIQNRKALASMKKRLNEATKNDLEHVSLQTSHQGLKEMYDQMDVIAESNSSVLILGQSGTGKEVMARTIHNQSDRKDSPFVVVNCAAIPATLFEAEFFGIKEGVATDVKEREGVFQKAQGGTLFLDEIGELPFEMQSKLLRVLQERRVSKVGSTEETPVDIRLISATNKNLLEDIDNNRFREDLYFRINVFQFNLPSLAERMDDLEVLANDLLIKICEDQNVPLKTLSAQAQLKLKSYDWPGNIRELKNVLERGCVLSKKSSEISQDSILLPERSSSAVSGLPSAPTESVLEEVVEMNHMTKQFQKSYALKVVEKFEGNKTKAAQSLNISREGLRKILKREVA